MFFFFFFFNDTATTEIYTLSLHDALPIYRAALEGAATAVADLPPAHAHSLEHQRAAALRSGVLADIPPDPLHAGGAALLGAADRCRLRRADPVRDPIFGPGAGPRDPRRDSPRAS